MENRQNILHKQVAERFVKVTWTHKIQEKQADIYISINNRYRNAQLCLSAIVTTGVISTCCEDWGWTAYAKIITTISTTVLTMLTLFLKNNGYEIKAKEHSLFAAKTRILKNKYESLLTDICSSDISEEQIRDKRSILEKEEAILFEDTPRTSKKALALAEVALRIKKESTTSDEEYDIFIPDYAKLD